MVIEELVVERDIEMVLDMLAVWWRAESDWVPVEGYPPECPSTRGYRSSRQYDSTNGADDTDARSREISHVGKVVASIDEPYRTALYEIARNRATMAWVWRSPRLPSDEEERAMIVSDALDMFRERV